MFALTFETKCEAVSKTEAPLKHEKNFNVKICIVKMKLGFKYEILYEVVVMGFSFFVWTCSASTLWGNEERVGQESRASGHGLKWSYCFWECLLLERAFPSIVSLCCVWFDQVSIALWCIARHPPNKPFHIARLAHCTAPPTFLYLVYYALQTLRSALSGELNSSFVNRRHPTSVAVNVRFKQ